MEQYHGLWYGSDSVSITLIGTMTFPSVVVITISVPLSFAGSLMGPSFIACPLFIGSNA